MRPPRGAALLPLLTVLGTTAAAAALAHKYVPQYFANKHKKRREQEQRDKQEDQEQEEPNKMKTQTVAAPAKAPVNKSVPVEPRSPEVAAVLLQDPYLLISAFGVCIMVVAVLVSLLLVEMREDVASLNDLQMFGPLMLVAMGLISLGMLLSMANPKKTPELVEEPEDEDDVVEEKTISPEDAAALKKAAQEGDQGFLYNYYKKKYANEPTEVEVEDENGVKKRVSRCPFGFT